MCELQKIGLGTYQMTGTVCSEIVKHAINFGYRVIDTAELYKNHADIAKGIKMSSQERKNIFIISKIHVNDIKQGTLRKGLDKIFSELGITYIDLLLLHGPQGTDENIEAWKTMELFAKGGLARYIGLSNYRINEVKEILAICRIIPYVNQIEVSPFNTRSELIEFCQSNGIKIQAYASLTKGKKLNNEVVIGISKKYKITAGQLLLRWGYQKGYYLIPKAANIHHMIENFMTGHETFPNISDKDIQLLDKLNENYYTIKYYQDR